MLNRLVNSINYRWHKQVAHRFFTASPAKLKQEKGPFFFFHGRVGQWEGMGQQLYRTEPIFKNSIRRFSQVSEDQIAIDINAFFEGKSKSESTVKSQHRGFISHGALQMALFDLWKSRGFYPGAVAGMSLGETIGAYAAGLPFEDAAHIICHLFVLKPEFVETSKILRIDMKASVIEELCREKGLDKVYLIADNSDFEAFFTCELSNLDALEEILRDNEIKSFAFSNPYEALYHTPRMDDCREKLLEKFQIARSFSLKYPFYSSVYGREMPTGTIINYDYFYRVLRQPALLGSALTAALRDGYRIFLNIGSHNSFDHSVKNCAASLDVSGEIEILDSMRKNESEKKVFESSFKRLKKFDFSASNVGCPFLRAGEKADEYISPTDIDDSDFDIFSPQVHQNPFPYYEALRQKGSIHFLKKQGVWLILDYKDVVSALKQPHIFSSRINQSCDAVLLGAEPNEHKRARRIIQPFLSAQAVENTTVYAENLAEKLLDEAARKLEFDILADFAVPFSERMMGHLIGLSPDEINVAAKMHTKISSGRNQQEHYFDHLREFFSDFLTRVSEKRLDKIYGGLLDGDGDNKLNRHEISSLLGLLWIAGTKTLNALISSSTLLLLRQPEIMRELKNDLGLIPQFVEEVMRFESPEPTIVRITLAEVEMEGIVIPAGARVHLCLAAANRDPKHYENSDILLLRRNPKDHLAFNAGSHFCPGAGLARMEARVALETLLKKMPELRAAQNLDAVHYFPEIGSRVFDKLIVAVK